MKHFTFIRNTVQWLLSLLLVLWSASSALAGDGTTCEKAIPISATGTFTYPESTTNYSVRYYSYTATADVTLSITRPDKGLVLGSVAEGCSGSDISSSSVSEMLAPLSAGKTYIITLISWTTTAFDWTLSTKANVKGDFCETPIAITADGDVNVAAAVLYKYIYYTYKAKSDGTLSIKGVLSKAGFEIKDGCDGNEYTSTQIATGYKLAVKKDLTYYISLMPLMSGSFVWNITNTATLAGEFCENPVSVTTPDLITYTNATALKKQYFAYTATKDGVMEIVDTNKSANVQVFADCANSSVDINNSYISRTVVTKDQTYLIEWSIYYGEENFKWGITLRDSLPGEFCNNATPITTPDKISFTNAPKLSTNFYSYKATKNGLLVIADTTRNISNITIYESCDGSSINNYYDNSYRAAVTKDQTYIIEYKAYSDTNHWWALEVRDTIVGEYCVKPIALSAEGSVNFVYNGKYTLQYYTYTPKQTAVLKFSDGPNASNSIAVYESCDESSSLGYNNEGELGVSVEANKTYYISWGASDKTNFTWTMSSRDSIVGEFCEKPLVIANDGQITFSVKDKIYTQYYRYKTTKDGMIVIDNPSYNSVYVYSDCPTTNRLDYSFGDIFKLQTLANKTYYIKWNTSSTTDFTWSIENRDSIAGEFCQKPIVISQEGTQNFSMANDLKTQYYTYTSAKNGIIAITTIQQNAYIYIYDACNGEELVHSYTGNTKLTVQANKTYYIKWVNYENNDFEWTINNRLPEQGEMCDKPIAIAAQGTIPFTWNSNFSTHYYSYTVKKNCLLELSDLKRNNYVRVLSSCNGDRIDYDYSGEILIGVKKDQNIIIAWDPAEEINFNWTLTERDSLVGEFCQKPITITAAGEQTFSDANDLTTQYYLFTPSINGIIVLSDGLNNYNTVSVFSSCNTAANASNIEGELKMAVTAGNKYIIRWDNSQNIAFKWTIINRDSLPGELTPLRANIKTIVSGSQSPVSVGFYLTTNADSVAWDFNNDGIIDSRLLNPHYIYTTTGTHYAHLYISNKYFASNVYSDAIVVTPTPSRNCERVTINAEITKNNCEGQKTGIIKLTTSGGTAPYNYRWSNTSSTPEITNLAADTYSVTVADVDSNLCVKLFTVDNTINLNINATVTNNTCNKSDGSIMAEAAGGTAPYGYVWSDSVKQANRTALSPNNYALTVSDKNGCRKTAEYSVTTEGMPSISFVTNGQVSCDSTDGYIKAIISGAKSGPYKFAWNDAKTERYRKQLKAGTYTAILTDTITKCSTSASQSLKAKVPQMQHIGLVSVSPESHKNIIAWERVQRVKEINSYIVLRQNNTTLQYEMAGRVPATSITVFRDDKVDPMLNSYRYSIIALDNCGNSSEPSPAHKTMKLAITKSSAYNDLTWDAYEGFDVRNFIVCRLNSNGKVDSLARKSYMRTTYRDLQPTKNARYFIVVNMLDSIRPARLKTDTGPFSQSFSNMSEASLVDNGNDSDSQQIVYPNPASTELHLNIDHQSINRAWIINSLGETMPCTLTSSSIAVTHLPSGVYTLKLLSNTGETTETRFVKQ